MGLPTTPLIMIIDDDEGVRRALRRLLTSLGCESLEFSSGETFLERPRPSRPGCVLMDLHLPGMNGIETLKCLRDRGPSPPVIVMTGFDEPGTRERCLAAGAVDYVTKPIEAVHLASVLGRALDPG
jgi:FixJ family two-component response regulator